MKVLSLTSPGKARWLEREEPTLLRDDDAIVRPFVAARCDADWLAMSAPLLRAIHVREAFGRVDPIYRQTFGPRSYPTPCALGHECVAEVIEVGSAVTAVSAGDRVVVPWSISCGVCEMCQRGLTLKCTTTRREARTEQPLVCYGLGAQAGSYGSGSYGGMISDYLRVPFANHMLAPIPSTIDPVRVAAASDSLTDAWSRIVPNLADRPNARVLIVAGLVRGIGLYAAGIAATQGARVDYSDSSVKRLEIAESLGARAKPRTKLTRFPDPDDQYDIVVDASNLPAGIDYAVRSTAPGGICEVPSYHTSVRTGVPLMHMTFTDITMHVGTSHAAATIPDVLRWVDDNDFPAEKVTPIVSEWNDAPAAYGTRHNTTKPAIFRSPIQ